MQQLLSSCTALMAAYLCGSLSSAILLARFFKLPDPRHYGSRNAGATNVLRGGNRKIALLTLLLDLFKGLIVVICAKYLLFQSPWLLVAAGVLVVIGHIYPIWFGFAGGKGVATALGVVMAINPLLGLISLLVWLVMFFCTRLSSLSALASIIAITISAIFYESTTNLSLILMLATILIYSHRDNIMRLLSAKEQRI